MRSNSGAILILGVLSLTGCGGGGGSSTSTSVSSSSSSSATTYTIGGTISGLTATGLTLENNAGNALAIASGASSFTFTTPIATGAAYSVTARTQPVGQRCVVSNGSGNVATANISNVSVRCGADAEGAYVGTLTGSTNSAFQLVILENGEYWAIYGNQTPATFFVSGLVQGTGVSNNGTFTSSDLKDFGFFPAIAGALNSTYNLATLAFSGTAAFSIGTVGFVASPATASTYNYNTAASLTTVSGAWALTASTGESVAVSISPTGVYSASTNLGCTFSGTVTPRPSGKNVFNVTYTFGPAPCALPGQAATGIAITFPVSAGKTQLIVGGVNSARNAGTVAFGTR